MQFKRTTLALIAASMASAQRPTNTSICDYYTTALLKNNTAANQYTLLTLVVNTAVIGNYTTPNVGIAVPGILAPGTYNGVKVNLLPYFDGELESSNRGGSSGVSVNFLDGGGAEPLKKNMPANDASSNQYALLTHLYQFFGALLGCSQYGMGPAFLAFTGHASMYEVHSFMDLNPSQVGYFIEQVAQSAASFGVADSDLQAVGTALNTLFGHRCAAPTTVIPAQGPQLQSICIDGNCPLADNATCAAYNSKNGSSAVVPPRNHTSGEAGSAAPGGSGNGVSSSAVPSGSATVMSTTGTATGTAATSKPTNVSSNGGAAVGISFAALAGGFAALML